MLHMPVRAFRANGALCAAASMQTLSRCGPAEQSLNSKHTATYPFHWLPCHAMLPEIGNARPPAVPCAAA